MPQLQQPSAILSAINVGSGASKYDSWRLYKLLILSGAMLVITVLILHSEALSFAPSKIYADPFENNMYQDLVKIYVTALPEKYVRGAGGLGAIETDAQYGFSSLGSLLSLKHDHWDTRWHHIDAWYNNQMMVSPLRVYNADTADIIFVPAMLSVKSPEDMNSFVEDAQAYLPYFGLKPHIVILSHGAVVYNELSHLLLHVNSKKFTFISFAQHDPKHPDVNIVDGSHLIGCPQLSHIHWSQGSWQLQAEARIFPRANLTNSKSIFSAESYGVRNFNDRFAAFEDCMARSDLCTHINYTGPQDAVLVHETYRAAWFVLHPRADFIARSAWFETIMADTIPVVFQLDYVKALPFADVLDYDRLMLVVQEEAFVGPDGENIIDILWNKFDQEEALKMLEYIHSVRHVFQYMLNPDHTLVRWSQRSKRDLRDDAFTFTLKSVLRKVCLDGWLSEKCQKC